MHNTKRIYDPLKKAVVRCKIFPCHLSACLMLTCKTLFEKDEDIRIYDIENVYVATGTRWMLKAKTKKTVRNEQY